MRLVLALRSMRSLRVRATDENCPIENCPVIEKLTPPK
jgi:hypothetical protein